MDGSAVSSVRLFTAHGTVVYVEPSGELRHGYESVNPENATFLSNGKYLAPPPSQSEEALDKNRPASARGSPAGNATVASIERNQPFSTLPRYKLT
jgi:hypothetical protein